MANHSSAPASADTNEASDRKHSDLSSSSQVVCRICQSETGAMVRPCACTGSVGTIHERCLNQWWDTSGKDACELCLEKYARTGRVLKPIREWTKPVITGGVAYGVVAFVLVSSCLAQMLILMAERRTLERLGPGGAGPRTHDWARFLILFVLLVCLLILVYNFTLRIFGYMRKQYTVRFTEHAIHKMRELQKN